MVLYPCLFSLSISFHAHGERLRVLEIEGRLLKKYAEILGTRISPISALGVRYFEKNYGKILNEVPESAGILEVGPGSAAFTQYLLYKGYKDITLCELADDNIGALRRFFGNRINFIHKEVNDYLETAVDRFDLIYAAQVIEHFSYENFIQFLGNCCKALNDNGCVIFETINCANITHGLYLRYCDFTHRMGFTPRSLKQFFMSVGEFSELRLIEIQPLGFLDFAHSFFHRIRGDFIFADYERKTDNSYKVYKGLKRLISILLKNLNIRFSGWVSFLILRPYGFDNIRIYTPFFAIMARKHGGSTCV
jgi:2-polyprenyl-3-methyl-5-hydroxy-6-metoxy-1,4-benzoquinol methylase